MIKHALVFIAVITNICVSAQDVRYYKLTRTRIDGIDNRTVSGGQFITFVGDKCFESNKRGVGVDHGILTRNSNYSNSQFNVYQGSSYWGSSTTFKFNADKSVLNVVLDNGDIYVYKRATPPAGVTTCSLLRKKRSDGFSGSASVSIQPTYPSYPASPSLQSPQQPSPSDRYVEKTYQCTYCHGKGTVWDCDNSIPDFTGSKKYCNECGRSVPMCHIHKRCPSCNGKGSYSKMERVN